MGRMAQEQQTPRYSNSSSGGGTGGGGTSGGGTSGGGGRSSKKLKQKKVPQRGLGVAQLEKIRLEEQQKDHAAFQSVTYLSPNSIISPSNSASRLAVQCTNFVPNLSPSFPPIAPTDLTSTTSMFRQPPIIPNIDVTRPMSVVPTSLPNDAVSGRGGWSKGWNGEYNNNQDGSAIRLNVSLPYESNTTVWPMTGVMQRSQQFHGSCPSSSMVNVTSGTSSSSVMNFRSEPPSNQSYGSNNYTPMWPEEERIVGVKRSYPFSGDDAPVPSFNCKFPPAYVSSIPKTDALALFSSEGSSNVEPANSILREGPSSSGVSEPNKKKLMKENGDFLTLAPPKPKQHSSYLSPHIPEVPDFDALPYQGAADGLVLWSGLGQSFQQPFFSFLPSANAENGESATSLGNHNGEVVEIVDLNLKL